MPGPRAVAITLSERQSMLLNRWVRMKSKTPQQLRERCQIVLGAAVGKTNTALAATLGLTRPTVRLWRTRFAAHSRRFADAEAAGATDKDYAALLASVLSDEPRSGRPPIFTAEQLTQIIAIACEKPEDSQRPVDRWTPPEIAAEAKKRQIVTSISPRHVDRLLKKGISDRIKADIG